MISIQVLLSTLAALAVWRACMVALQSSSTLRSLDEEFMDPDPSGKSLIQSRNIVPLQVLTGSHRTVRCNEGLLPVYDTLVDSSSAFRDRRIPRIVHLTSRSRCVHPDFQESIDSWRLPGHSLFFHDDEAMDKLLYRDWPEFPQLKYVIKCLLYGGAAKADIWRILVLWEYGGIYADIDSSPNPEKFNATTLTADDDAFFVIEVLGTASQWFMAASPRHPMMYFTMMEILSNLMALEDVGYLPIIWTTGPGAVAQGFRRFLGPRLNRRVGRKPPAGVYPGPGGRTVKLVGSSQNENEYITRNVYESVEKLRRPGKNIYEAKHESYQSMGMAHLTTFDSKEDWNLRNESCYWRMWRSEMENAVHWKPNW